MQPRYDLARTRIEQSDLYYPRAEWKSFGQNFLSASSTITPVNPVAAVSVDYELPRRFLWVGFLTTASAILLNGKVLFLKNQTPVMEIPWEDRVGGAGVTVGIIYSWQIGVTTAPPNPSQNLLKIQGPGGTRYIPPFETHIACNRIELHCNTGGTATPNGSSVTFFLIAHSMQSLPTTSF